MCSSNRKSSNLLYGASRATHKGHTKGPPISLTKTLDAFMRPFGEGAIVVGGVALISPGAVFLVAAVLKAAGSQLCFLPPRIPLSMSSGGRHKKSHLI